MKVRVQEQVIIHRPLEATFAFVADVSTWPKWITPAVAVEVTSSGPLAEGSQLRGVGAALGRQLEVESVVTVFEPPYRLVHQSPTEPIPSLNSFQLEPVAGGTRLIVEVQVRPGGMARFMAPMIQQALTRFLRQDLGRLKRLLEA